MWEEGIEGEGEGRGGGENPDLYKKKNILNK